MTQQPRANCLFFLVLNGIKKIEIIVVSDNYFFFSGGERLITPAFDGVFLIRRRAEHFSNEKSQQNTSNRNMADVKCI